MIAEPLGGLADERLVELAADGDGDAFAELYRRHLPLVLAFLRRQTRRPDLAADLAAETFIAALSSLRGGRSQPPSAAAWLLTIARSKLIDSFRRGRVEEAARRRLGLERLELHDEDIEQVERIASATDLDSVLAELLPPDQAEAVTAYVIDERDYEDIARELKTSKAVVRKRVSRGLQGLRSQLKGRRDAQVKGTGDGG